MFGIHRYIFNLLITKTNIYYKNNKYNKKDFNNLFRKYVIKKEMINIEETNKEYILNQNEELLDSTYRDFIKALESNHAKSHLQKSKTGKGYKCNMIKFKTKKQPSQSIELRSRSIKLKDNKLYFFTNYFNKIGFKIKNKLPEIKYSCRLQRLRNGKYYLCIPINKNKKLTKTNNSCALDPGVRTFLTLYDPKGLTIELGTNFKKIMSKCINIDKIKSKLKKNKYKKRNKRYNIKKEYINIQQKIKNMIKDSHHKIAKFLVINYDEILLPTFKTQQMSKKINRKISNKCVRQMLTWSHYKFKIILKTKAELYNKKIYDCSEAYTSKTCTNCQKINDKLGSSKVFKCKNCNLILDRDINAARNIYKKNLSLLSDKFRRVEADYSSPKFN